MADHAPTQISREETIELSAFDSEFYARTFFPLTMRQKSPLYHRDIWALLEDRDHRQVALEVFRDGAKTSILRLFSSKRIAYGTSRTIFIVGPNQDLAINNLRWLKKHIERNRLWCQIYGLSKGSKWTDTLIEINHEILDAPITVMAVGITGQTRGINIDDYRPDLIVVDDPCDEENTGTPEQRKKISDVFFGSLLNSLAPESECPDAKVVLLQTSLHEEDLINTCHGDTGWASRKYSCFDEVGESRWPDRYPTEVLRKRKADKIRLNQLTLWLREMECVTVGGEAARLKSEWLRYWDTLPDNMVILLAIDPVPPPSEREVKMGLQDKDFEAIFVLGVAGFDYFVLEYSTNRGHTPEWTITEFFRLVDKWRPLRCRVEGVAYQKTLKWILEEAMKRRGRFIQVNAPSDKRSKSHRIIQAYSGIASQGRLFVHRTHIDFISQFGAYPNCAHDDILDAGSNAIDEAMALAIDVDFEVIMPKLLEPVEEMYGAP